MFSTAVGITITIVYLNVVVRRESAYVIEERINSIIDYAWRPTSAPLHAENPTVEAERSQQPLPGTSRLVSSPPSESAQISATRKPAWMKESDFRGLVVDNGQLMVRWVVANNDGDNPGEVVEGSRPIDQTFLEASGAAAGFVITDINIEPVSEYRATEGLAGEIVANFLPGSGHPVPVIVTARNWRTGEFQDIVICRVHLNYRHTLHDLVHMGIRRASWLSPLLTLSGVLLLFYVLALAFCIRLGRGIAVAVNALSIAAHRIGSGDLQTQIHIAGDKQLARLADDFNHMTSDLVALQERERLAALISADVALASEVQAYLTPTKIARLEGATVWSTSTPARRVSGDLHEIFTLSPDKLALVCADVSGKGVSSALVMAHIQGLLHAYLCGPAKPSSPARLAGLLNQELCHRLPVSRYATFFYGEVDLRERVLTYVNAGHSSPLLLSSTGANFLREGNVPIGLFPDTEYTDQKLTLSFDDTLIIYTDGITEALSKADEQYGEKRLLSFCNEFPDRLNAEAFGKALRDEVMHWARDVERFDDATILVLCMTDSEAEQDRSVRLALSK